MVERNEPGRDPNCSEPQSDPAIEAYLVRHNQMLANDGMGGFVPYVDVVASDSAATASDPEAASPDAGTSQP